MLARQRIILLNKIISSKVLHPFKCVHDDSTTSTSTPQIKSSHEQQSECETETISNNIDNDSIKLKIPPPPQTCCGSGCQNCVWIAYAEEITKCFQDGGYTARNIILDQIDDINMRSFVGMQLRLLQQAEENEKKK